MYTEDRIDTASVCAVYKICSARLWNLAVALGSYAGGADDARDGFIHLSSARQLRGTADKHFAGQEGLLLIAVKTSDLGAALKWERSRGGRLFPHLYGPLPISAVAWTAPLPLAKNGCHLLPDLGQRDRRADAKGAQTAAEKPTASGMNE